MSCGALSCALAALYMTASLNMPSVETKSSFFQVPLVLGAHRGGADWLPENSLLAFKEATRRWPNIVIETDVRLTADGVVVLNHDATVDRTTDGTGAVSKLTFAELAKLDAAYRFTRDGGETYPYRGAGIRIPNLAEVLEALPETRFIIELKDHPGIDEAVLRVVENLGATDRVVIGSFDAELMKRLRLEKPSVLTCYDLHTGASMLESLRGGEWANYQPEADMLAIERSMISTLAITPRELQQIRDKGIYIQVHTLNTLEELREAMDWGVDSILTDRPDMLSDLLASAKMASDR